MRCEIGLEPVEERIKESLDLFAPEPKRLVHGSGCSKSVPVGGTVQSLILHGRDAFPKLRNVASRVDAQGAENRPNLADVTVSLLVASPLFRGRQPVGQEHVLKSGFDLAEAMTNEVTGGLKVGCCLQKAHRVAKERGRTGADQLKALNNLTLTRQQFQRVARKRSL
jgi:hypothetical protein